MWNSTKQTISAGDHSINAIGGGDVYVSLDRNIPTDLVNQRIEEEVEKLRKSRFFVEFDRVGSSLRLGRLLAEGNLSGGSDEVRGRALAWCARLLSRSEDPKRAEEFLRLAKTLGDFLEVKIAEAFVISQQGDKVKALQTLAGIDSDTSRSARLMIVAHHDGSDNAIKWAHDVGYTVGELDSDGKSILLTHQLELGRWDEVTLTVGAFSDNDFDETPVLHHLAGLATLVTTVPQDFRAHVLTQVPFEAREFPLAADAVAMDARRAAHKYFLNAVEAATQL